MSYASLLPSLKEYVSFDAESARRLQAMGSRIRPYHGRIVDGFYQAVLDDPGARAVLKSKAQVGRLKVTLAEWLEGLFSGSYDEAYFEKRARIGRAHVRVGLEQRYMLAAMNVVRLGLHHALSEASDDGFGAFQDHHAIDQICDIELAIMLETYREDYVLKKTAEAESPCGDGEADGWPGSRGEESPQRSHAAARRPTAHSRPNSRRLDPPKDREANQRRQGRAPKAVAPARRLSEFGESAQTRAGPV